MSDRFTEKYVCMCYIYIILSHTNMEFLSFSNIENWMNDEAELTPHSSTIIYIQRLLYPYGSYIDQINNVDDLYIWINTIFNQKMVAVLIEDIREFIEEYRADDWKFPLLDGQKENYV